MKKFNFLGILIVLSTVAFGQTACDFWYVSPTGTGIDGTPTAPVDFEYALSNVTPARNHIRVLGGTYTYTDKVALVSDVVIEGGYQISGSDWVLSSNVSTNFVINPPLEVVNAGGTDVGHYIGFEAVGLSNFVLRNLNISVQSAGASGTTSDRGNSIYGVYLEGCSDYTFSRVVVNTGNASDGLDGADGADGLIGVGGDPGSAGNCDGCFFPWCNSGSGAPGGAGGLGGGGTAAGSAGTGVNGGGGGKGGNGGREGNNSGQSGQTGGGVVGSAAATTGGGAAGGGGDPGGDGSNGSNGVSGADGANGSTSPAGVAASGFFIPGSIADAGANGIAGKGGRGGGGGGGQGCSLCDDGPGNAGGGAGGGGQAGTGGVGGTGGGSAYGIFAWSNGANADVIDSDLAPGAAGNGGQGGAGGDGANGGQGDSGATTCSSEIGEGGDGGNGGNGGNGGDGADGADGVSISIEVDGTAANVAGTSIPANYNPVTVLQNQGCTNSEILVTKNGGSFDLGAMGGAVLVNDIDPTTSSYTVGASSVAVYYSTLGIQDVVISGVRYNDYVDVVTNRPLPALAVLNDGAPVTTACEGLILDMNTDDGSLSYDWAIVKNGVAVVPTGGNGDTATTHLFDDIGTYHVRLRVKDECCGWSIPVYQEVTITPGPVVNLGVTDTSICQQNAIDFDAGGGYIDYLWEPNGDTTQVTTVNTTGIYTVTVTDANGCSGEGQVQVSATPPINLIVTPDGPTSFCVGGEVTLTSDAGFNDYLWSDGATTGEELTVTQSGDYYVSVVDNLGCTGISQIVQVSVNALPNAAIAANGPISFCPGDSVVLNAPAGYPTYVWSNSDNDESTTILEAGTVTVTVTNDQGCENTGSVDVVIYPQPNPVIIPGGPLTFCFGDDVVLSLDEGYSSYLWSSGSSAPTITVTEAGEYGVSVLDANGCVDSTLLANPVTVEVWDPEPIVVQNGDSLVITNPGDFTSVQWYYNGVPISGGVGNVYVVTESGNYTAVGTDANGCEGSSFNYEMTCCVGIEEASIVSRLVLYPNPTDGIITLEADFLESSQIQLNLYDVRGKRQFANVIQSPVSNIREAIDMSELPSGVYSLQIIAGDRSLVRRVILQQEAALFL